MKKEQPTEDAIVFTTCDLCGTGIIKGKAYEVHQTGGEVTEVELMREKEKRTDHMVLPALVVCPKCAARLMQ